MKTKFKAASAAILMLAIVPAAAAAPEAAKAPAAGAIIWKQQFGTAQSEGISRLAVDGSGNVIAYGSTAGTLKGANKGGTDVFLAKYSPAGAQTSQESPHFEFLYGSRGCYGWGRRRR